MDRKTAEAAGWEFDTSEPGLCVATRDTAEVRGNDDLDGLAPALAMIDQLENGIAASGVGSTDPAVPASVAVQTAVAAAMATVTITSPTLTDAQKKSIHDQVTAQVQGVIDQHLETTA